MIEYQPTCKYAVTATMPMARNTMHMPISGIFANKSGRAIRLTSMCRNKRVPSEHPEGPWRVLNHRASPDKITRSARRPPSILWECCKADGDPSELTLRTFIDAYHPWVGASSRGGAAS